MGNIAKLDRVSNNKVKHSASKLKYTDEKHLGELREHCQTYIKGFIDQHKKDNESSVTYAKKSFNILIGYLTVVFSFLYLKGLGF